MEAMSSTAIVSARSSSGTNGAGKVHHNSRRAGAAPRRNSDASPSDRCGSCQMTSSLSESA